MKYKYYVMTKVDPNQLESILKNAGEGGWELIHVQPMQEFTAGVTINNQPVVKLYYQLIFKKPLPDAT